MRIDLVNISGRESLSPKDRIDLMRADLMAPPFFGIMESTRASSQTIHDLKLTTGAIRGTIELYEQAISRGQTDETLAKGADQFFSDIECQILAWRRGGHREYQRIRKQQRDVGWPF